MEKKVRFGFRMVHIDNIQHIDKYGFVHPDSPHAATDYIPIGDSTIIQKRKEEYNGIRLSDFIPFYFGPRSPMLYVIQHGYNGVTLHKAEDIVYCVIKVADIIANQVDCMFTDGHALSMLTTFYPPKELKNLNDYVKYDDVYALSWKSEDDIDKQRRKEAELLIKEELSSDYLCAYVVYNDNAKKRLIEVGIDENKIYINPGYYY